MKVKFRTVCSAVMGIAWLLLVLKRGDLIYSGECSPNSTCDLMLVLAISLVGLYVTLELIVSPESAALFILNKAIRRRASPSVARAVGVFGTIMMLFALYWSVTQLLGFSL